MFEKELQKAGLTSGEAKVYESLLLLGPSTVGPVVKRASVAYSNIYEILNRLMEKGLVSFITRDKTKYFQAVEPRRLSQFLDNQEEQLRKSRLEVDELAPRLEKLMKLASSKEEVEIFSGVRGLETAYENLLFGAKKGDVLFFFYQHEPDYYDLAEQFYFRQWPWLKKKGILARGISNESYRHTALSRKSPSLITSRYVPFPVPGNFDILSDKVLITSWQERPVGILIESREIAENFKKYFQSLWVLAKQ
ncbi:MAG: helix-turn-helix domain-containing protein [Nanoarchaeota archaeon]